MSRSESDTTGPRFRAVIPSSIAIWYDRPVRTFADAIKRIVTVSDSVAMHAVIVDAKSR